MDAGSLSRSRASSIIAGSAAMDDRALNAMDCGVSQTRQKLLSGACPRNTAAGYKIVTQYSVVTPHTITVYPASAPSAESPSLVASGTASAKTPYGAVSITQRTMVSVA